MRKLKIILSIILIAMLLANTSFAISLPSVSTSRNTVNVAGKLDETNSNVTLIILDENGTRQYLDQTKTDDEGAFSFEFNLNNGNYTGKVSTELHQYDLNFKVKSSTSHGKNTEKNQTPTEEQINNEVAKERKSFKDIGNHWARNEIELLAGKGIISGMGDDAFMPEEKITRAQFATMIFNLLELKSEEYMGKFEDVKETDWFWSAVESVAKAGIVLGADGYFYPNNEITREEMAVMIVRSMELKEINILSSSIDFNDKEDISSWAVDSVSKAINTEIIKGMTATTFEPRQHATRAQASVMLYRFMELLENK